VTHFTEREIREWSESGPGADRDRVIAHVGGCPRCAAIYAEAIRARPMTSEEAGDGGADTAEYVQAGYDVAARQGSVVPFPSRRRRTIVSVATAAALIAALAIPYTLRLRDRRGEPAYRGGGIHALIPSGSVAEGTEFQWSSDLSAVTFRLDIGDATGVVHSQRTSDTHAGLRPDAWGKLSPNVEYWWTVTALDRDGRPVVSSERQAFRIRPR
jgi:hypothetical protein